MNDAIPVDFTPDNLHAERGAARIALSSAKGDCMALAQPLGA
jgi:hypothetical protein